MGLEKVRQKIWEKFVDLISNYVEENSITRPDDLIIKSTGQIQH